LEKTCSVISHVDVISKTEQVTHHVLKTLSTRSSVIQRLTLTWCVVKNRTAALDEPWPNDAPLPLTRSGTCIWNWAPEIALHYSSPPSQEQNFTPTWHHRW